MMSPELSQFLTAHGTVLVLVVGLLAALGVFQWRKVRVAELELESRRALVEQGMAVAEVEKLLGAHGPARKGLVEQFAALSGGAKTGVIVGMVIAVTVTVSTIGGAIHSHAFWSNVRQQQAGPPPGTSGGEGLPGPESNPDAVEGRVFYLDLQPAANQRLNEAIDGDKGNSLAGVPRGRHAFGGVPFEVGPSFIRLRGKNLPKLSREARGLRVGLALDKLHFLHATEFGAFGDEKHPFFVPDGVEVGHFRVHYADESDRAIPLVYGEDVRDGWNWDKSRAAKRARVAWTGTNPSASRNGASLRLYLMTWENPRPEVEVTRLDYVSAGGTAASPFCVAITAERRWK